MTNRDVQELFGWRLRGASLAVAGLSACVGLLVQRSDGASSQMKSLGALLVFLLLIGLSAYGIERLLTRRLRFALGGLRRQSTPAQIKVQQLEKVIEALPAGLLLADAEGQVRLANQRLHELLALRQDPSGERLAELPAADELLQVSDRARRHGETAHASLVRPESPYQPTSRRQLTLAAVPMGDAGALILIQDLTDVLHQLETHRQLVANVSHEIKTPLTAIRGYAETLEDGALDRPEVARLFTGRILEQCTRLQDVLEDLLLVARLENEQRPENPSKRVDLVASLKQSLEVVASQAQAKSVRLALHVVEPVPTLPGHADELDHMLLNLLDNSIKYNRDGGRVDVTLSRQNDELCLDVHDTGIGIPGSDLQRIFERFYRVDKGRSRLQGGTGLGLAIVEQVVALHHGRINVESTLGSGSRFRVYLPAPSDLPNDSPEVDP